MTPSRGPAAPGGDRLRARIVGRLAAAGCVSAGAEADEMLRRAGRDAGLVDEWVDRRVTGEPLAWITGHAAFGPIDVAVPAGVYPPRPWSAELARRAASVLPVGGRALDLCTGCGAVAALLAAAVPTASVVAIDIDPLAVAGARRNGVAAVVGDVSGPIVDRPVLDVVAAVAPYVPTDAVAALGRDVRAHEPRVALDGGADGLDVVRRVVEAAGRRLRPGGSILVELGGDQDALIAPALAVAGLADVATWHDPEGDLLGLSAVRRVDAAGEWGPEIDGRPAG